MTFSKNEQGNNAKNSETKDTEIKRTGIGSSHFHTMSADMDSEQRTGQNISSVREIIDPQGAVSDAKIRKLRVKKKGRAGYKIERWAYLGDQIQVSSLDNKILEILRSNCRADIGKISMMLGVSPATVKRHIEWLRSRKLILGFTVLLNPNLFHSAVRCFILIKLKDRISERVIRKIEGMDYIGSLYKLSEGNTLLMDVVSRNLEDLEYLEDRLSRISGISRIESILTSKPYKKNPWYSI